MLDQQQQCLTELSVKSWGSFSLPDTLRAQNIQEVTGRLGGLLSTSDSYGIK